jgi:hypothetical protein
VFVFHGHLNTTVFSIPIWLSLSNAEPNSLEGWKEQEPSSILLEMVELPALLLDGNRFYQL